MPSRTATYRAFEHAEKLLTGDLAGSIVQRVIDKLYDGNVHLDSSVFINRFIVMKNNEIKYVYACCAEDKGEDLVLLMTRKDAKSLPERDGVSFISMIDKFDAEFPRKR